MYLRNIKNKKIIIYLFYSVIFLIGFNIYKDYGLALDDEFYRKNGEIYYEYIKILFSNRDLLALNGLESLSQKMSGEISIINHPALFEILLASFVDIFDIRNSKEIFEFSHLLNFLIFFFGLIFFSQFIYKRFNSYNYAIFSLIILFFSPRFFAESFYNSRDIFFLSLFLVYLHSAYIFLKNQNFKGVIYLSFTSALLINAKILGMIPPIIFLFFYFLNSLSNNKVKVSDIKFIFYIISTTIFLMFIFSPYLWSDPISNLINSYITVVEEHNKLVIVNHYFGDFISSTNTPWHFRIVWFFITTPLFVVVFFIFGFILLLIQIINGLMKINSTKDDLWKSRDQMFDFYLFILLIIMLMLTIKFNTSQFGGWRHLYFLYPVVIFLSLLGLEFFINLFKNSKFKIFIFLLIGLNLSYIFNWIYVNHPHQQVYFNFASKKYVISKFDLDYWGLSNIHSLKHIVERENKFPIKVGTVSFSSVEASIFMLDENTKKNILVVYELDEADFLIDNYKRRIRKNFKIDENEFEKYFEIIVDGIPINTVYKKIN